MKTTSQRLARTRRALAAVVFVILCSNAPRVPAQPADCDRECLSSLITQYLDAVLGFEQMAIPAVVPALPWAETVRFSENDVGLMIGDGLWGTLTAIAEGYVLADPMTQNVFWLGVVEEHGQAAYLALRLGVTGGKIAEVEAIVGREGTPAPFASTESYSVDSAFSRTLPEGQRLPRGRLEALVDGYYSSLQLNDGTIQTEIADDCVRRTNGFVTSQAQSGDAQGCRQQLEIGLFRYVDRVRARRYPIIDESRGIVVAVTYLDHAARYAEYETLDGRDRTIPVEYPNSHAVLELFKIEEGKISRIEGVTAFQPYLMPTPWVR
jgi:hypothetical protein